MGTRNLTCVFADGEYRIAQYGQWDGYPEGQGATALAFLRSADLTAFKAKCMACKFMSDNELRALGSDWKETHPQLSRDNGAEILGMVNGGVRALKNEIDFAGDSLFCEWAYVVDLDAGAFEVYKGFNREPVPAGERFADFPRDKQDSKYYPVRLVKKFALNDLPSEEEFVRICTPRDEGEDE